MVGNDKRTRRLSAANRISLVTIVADLVAEQVHVGKRLRVARVVRAPVRSIKDVVSLISDVAGVAEEESGADLVARRGVRAERWVVAFDALLDTEDAAASTEHVADDVGALRVTTDDELGERAGLGVGGHLGETVGRALSDTDTVVDAEGVVVQDILVVAAGKTIADCVD